MNKLFGNISVEEIGEGAVGPITAEEVIAAEENLQEIHEIEMEATAAVVAMEDGEKAIASLEEAAAKYDAILAQPESISPAHVLVAQENLRMTAIGLGVEEAELQDIIGEEVSVEDATSNPVTGMELSRESVGGFIRKIFEQVKAFFKRIGVQVKKLYVKAVAFFNNTEKKAKKLLEEYKDRKDTAGAKLSDKQVDSIKNKLAVAGINSGKINQKSVLEYLAAITDTGTLKQINDAVATTDGLSADQIKDAAAVKKTFEGFSKAFEGAINKNSMFKQAGDKIKGWLGKEDTTNLVATYPVKVSGKGMTVILMKEDSEKLNSDDALKRVSAISYTKKSVSLEKTALYRMDVATLGFGEINAILGAVVKSNSVTFAKEAAAIMDTREKAIDKFEKEQKSAEPDQATKAWISKYVSVNQTTATSMSLDAILGAISGCSNVVSACTVYASAHNK